MANNLEYLSVNYVFLGNRYFELMPDKTIPQKKKKVFNDGSFMELWYLSRSDLSEVLRMDLCDELRKYLERI